MTSSTIRKNWECWHIELCLVSQRARVSGGILKFHLLSNKYLSYELNLKLKENCIYALGSLCFQ